MGITKKQKKIFYKMFQYCLLIMLGSIIIYPLIWLFFATFKSNSEIFGSAKILPEKFSFSPYIEGFKGNGQFHFGLFFVNTFKLVIPSIAFTVISSILSGYSFARFSFPFKRLLFYIMLATLMLPNAVVIIPRFILFNKFRWVNSYLPFYIPALLACQSFFIYMAIQFLRGLPVELDESAKIDGCNSFMILWRILLPLSKSLVFSIVLFQFIWTWNDFFNPLIYINSVKKYPVSLALKMSLDINETTQWSNVLSMALLSMLPCIILFFAAQKYFVEGIAASGLKG